MGHPEAAADRSDPDVRATARCDRIWMRDLRRRIGVALVLGGLAIAAPLVAAPVTGNPGATIGALVAAALLIALAVAAWPHEWSAEEREHHVLEAIWREVRADADDTVPWERYAAWAEARDERVELALLSCAPEPKRIAGAPSPYRFEVTRRLDAEDVAAAADAMEQLRAEAAERELRARRKLDEQRSEAERLEHERALRAIDDVAAADQRARDEQLARELAAEQAAERRAQADAVARALRRP